MHNTITILNSCRLVEIQQFIETPIYLTDLFLKTAIKTFVVSSTGLQIHVQVKEITWKHESMLPVWKKDFVFFPLILKFLIVFIVWYSLSQLKERLLCYKTCGDYMQRKQTDGNWTP